MVTTEEQLAQFIIDTPAQSISGSLLKEVKRCVINLMAVCIYSARDPSLDILLNVFRVEGAKPKATVVGSGFRTSMQNTALANGYLAHLEDYDDTHFPTVIHPSAPVIPAALAMGEYLGSSGQEVLAASAIGMEVCCRIGMAVHPAHYDAGWHITGTCGVFGSVAAAGRLLGLDKGQMVHAMGIAGTQAAGVREVFGSMAKPLHPGRAAQSGVLAALLAKGGFTGSKTILEGRRGFPAVASTSYDLTKATTGLGQDWEIRMNALKPYSCGVVNHCLIDAMVALRIKDGVTPQAIKNIKARVHPLVLELVDRRHPKVGLESKFSFQHSMAVGLVDGAAHPAQYTDMKATDPVIVGLRDRISATVDAGMAEDATQVTITLNDGRTYTQEVLHATGSPENPMTDAQLEVKFRTLAGDALSKARVNTLLEELWTLDDAPDIGQVMSRTKIRGRTVRN
ncbi:MAG TPA: MmgE/PrpD family protein [Dehalococcoidia bacterium]|nr:MmgE/PrpD family protein [Dehalococcoidia bacterium]